MNEYERFLCRVAGITILIAVALVAIEKICARHARGQTRDNPYKPEVVKLGRALFWDTRLSIDNSTACVTCHQPNRGWTDNKNISEGRFILANGRVVRAQGTRNSPPVFNIEDEAVVRAGNVQWQFWDAVSAGPDAQAFRPLENQVEMGNQSTQQVANRLNAIPGYRRMFHEAFGGDATPARITAAIAWYMRSLVIDDSPWDKFVGPSGEDAADAYLATGDTTNYRGDPTAMTASQKNGRRHFVRLNCTACHFGANLRDNQVHNIGVSLAFGDNDLGYGNVQRLQGRQPTMDGAFKTPTLRNLADTAPYFHSGRAQTIDDVLAHLNRGGGTLQGTIQQGVDPLIQELRGQLSDPTVYTELKDYLMNALRGTVPQDTQPPLP